MRGGAYGTWQVSRPSAKRAGENTVQRTYAEQALLDCTIRVSQAGSYLSDALRSEAGLSRLTIESFHGKTLEEWNSARKLVDHAMAEYSAAMDRLMAAVRNLAASGGSQEAQITDVRGCNW